MSADPDLSSPTINKRHRHFRFQVNFDNHESFLQGSKHWRGRRCPGGFLWRPPRCFLRWRPAADIPNRQAFAQEMVSPLTSRFVWGFFPPLSQMLNLEWTDSAHPQVLRLKKSINLFWTDESVCCSLVTRWPLFGCFSLKKAVVPFRVSSQKE